MPAGFKKSEHLRVVFAMSLKILYVLIVHLFFALFLCGFVWCEFEGETYV